MNLACLAARMVKPKHRTAWETALTEGWVPLQKCLRPEMHNCQVLSVVESGRYPRLSDYGSAMPFTYCQLDDGRFECKHYDVGKQRWCEAKFSEVFPKFLTEKCYVFAGSAGMGKTWFAAALAKEASVLNNPDVPLQDRSFAVANNFKALSGAKLQPGGAIMVDDATLGAGVFWATDADEFIKAALTPWMPVNLRVICGSTDLPEGPRIYTCNKACLEDWVRSRDGNLPEGEEFVAACRRVVWIDVKRKLFSQKQEESARAQREASHDCKMENMKALRESGAWA